MQERSPNGSRTYKKNYRTSFEEVGKKSLGSSVRHRVLGLCVDDWCRASCHVLVAIGLSSHVLCPSFHQIVSIAFVEHSFYTMHIGPSSETQACACKCPFTGWGLLFPFCGCCIMMHKIFLLLIKSKLSLFLLFPSALASHLRSLCWIQHHEVSAMCSSDHSIVLALNLEPSWDSSWNGAR